jgi:fluoroacetyl-CoA thioesterase
MAELTVGVSAEVALVVGEADTAAKIASGAVPVLATPRLIALLEEAAFVAVQPLLAQGQTTVGTRVDVRHLAATPVGMQVVAFAELVELEGKVLRFRVEARDERELVMEGIHERAVVTEARFIERVTQKLQADA